jgi:hypothetical protein
MTTWTHGYVTDIGYTYGYYAELNPLRTELAFLNAGLEPPVVKNSCELGFGQGMSVNLHAAASSVNWYGTDFNPSQAGFAQQLAITSGAKAQLSDQAFAEFCGRTDLPDFEYIGLHGIWSWISDDNRAVIVDFVRRKLAVGGVLYISYNTLPGWSSSAPLRHLMNQHAEKMSGAGQGIISQVTQSLEFTQQIIDTKPIYTNANPNVAARFSKLKEQNKSYLAHEYFNQDWNPMYFADMVKWLEPAKVKFACSTHFLDHIDPINLSTDQQQLLSSIPDADFKQTVRDYMVNQQFRKDYWVKGARKLDSLRQAERLNSHRVVLITPRVDVPLKVQGALGEATLNEPIYSPILDALSDHKIRSIGALETMVKEKGINLLQLTQSLVVLSGMGVISSVQDDNSIRAAQKITPKINLDLMLKSRSQSDLGYLASPVTGGGFAVSRFNQLFLLAIHQGRKNPQEWADFVWQILKIQGQRIIKAGELLSSPEENLAELTAQAITFADKQLPILKILQIV